MVHYIDNFLSQLDDILDSDATAETCAFLRGELTAFYLTGYIGYAEFERYQKALFEKEISNEKN